MEPEDVMKRQGWYKDSKKGWTKQSTLGLGWCRECCVKVRFCECGAYDKKDEQEEE